jgi:mannonate dehydratase
LTVPPTACATCTGSLSARGDNDLPGIVERLGRRINAVHLRSVQRNPDGSFFEANHLEGSVDMPAVVSALLRVNARRAPAERLSFRPDHGRRMLDDLSKPPNPMPGYDCIGRMKGLAELRGLQLGLSTGISAD